MYNENSPSNKDKLTAANLTQLINQVSGVIESKITVDKDNFIQEIYVLADKTRSAKQIVRDIETATAVEFDSQLDHRKISVVQLNNDYLADTKKEKPRLVFKNITTEFYSKFCRIVVELEDKENKRTFSAKAEGANSKSNQLKLVAKAVLEVIKKIYDPGCDYYALDLEDAAVVSFSYRDIALSSVSMVKNNGEETLIGSCVVNADNKTAVAKATLDAVNRRISYIF